MATQEQAINFTRASTKWVWNASGQLVEVPVDQPAYDHDPVTGEPLGVLIEPAATNLLLNFSPNYSRTDVSFVEETDGKFPRVVTATVDSTGTDEGSVIFGSSIASANFQDSFTRWGYLHKGNVDSVIIAHRYSLGGYLLTLDFTTETLSGGSSTSNYQVLNLGGGWFFFSFRINPDKTDSSLDNALIVRFDNPQVGDYCSCGGMQVESGPATSYIPTNGAPVTRARDIMTRSLGAEFNPSAGTIFIEYESPLNVSGTYGRYGGLLFRLAGNGSGDNGTANIFTAGRFSGNLSFSFRDRDGTGYDMGGWRDGPPLPYGQKNRIAVCYNSGVGFIAAANGSSNTHSFPNLPSVNWSYMGLARAYDNSIFHGHKSDIRYYPYAMTAAELEALTAL